MPLAIFRSAAAISLLFTIAAAPLPSPLPTMTRYVDLATLALASPVVVRATIEKASRISAKEAPGLAPGQVRFLVTAATTAAIVASDTVPPRFDYLADAPLDARGKPPKLKGVDVLLFLRPVTAASGQFTLVSARSQIAFTPAADAIVRSVLTEARANTVPVFRGVTSAFRVPGAVPGEAESQFFLSTADGKPVSLVVLSRPGQEQRLTIALGDVIDEAATAVRRDTLLWYRLACFLPRTLPTGLGDEAVASDYAFALSSLGPCNRTL